MRLRGPGIRLQFSRLTGSFCAAPIVAVARAPQQKKPAGYTKAFKPEALHVGIGRSQAVALADTLMRISRISTSGIRMVPDGQAVWSGMADAVVATAPA